MKMTRYLTIAAALLFLAAPASADDWSKKSDLRQALQQEIMMLSQECRPAAPGYDACYRRLERLQAELALVGF